MSRNSSSSSSSEDLVVDKFSWPIIHCVLTLEFYAVVVELLGHFLLLLVSVILACKCLRLELRRTADHALYSTLGLFLCVGESQLLMCPACYEEGSWVRHYLHVCLGAVALCAGFVGILSKGLSKSSENERYDAANQEPHFASKHSYCGLFGYLLFGGCVISGLGEAFLSHIGPLHLVHRILGVLCFICLASSQWFSYNSAFARRHWTRRWILFLKLASLGGVVCVLGLELYGVSGHIVRLLPASGFLRLDEERA